MNDLERIRWDCRRGMLELDIVLERFLAQHFGDLTPSEISAFRELLAYPDTELWRQIQSDKAIGDDKMRRVLDLLRLS